MATERGPKFEGDDYGSRHEARVDHHEEFGRIESNDYMARARLKETFEGTPTFAAERSVDATGQAFDHQQYAQNDSAFATGAAGLDASWAQRAAAEQQAMQDAQSAAERAYADQQYAQQQAYEAQQQYDYYQNAQQYAAGAYGPLPTDEYGPAYASGSARFVEEGGLQTDITMFEDGRYVGTERAQEGGVFGAPAESGVFATPLRGEDAAYGDYRSMGDYNHRSGEDVATVSEGDVGADPLSASRTSLSGGATYLDTWANEELQARRASVADTRAIGDEGQVVETAGDIFFVDRKFDYAGELTFDGDGSFDIDRVLKGGDGKVAGAVAPEDADAILAYVGEEGEAADAAKAAGKGKKLAKNLAKAGAAALLEEATGGSGGDVAEDAVRGTPSAAKKAKGFYSKLHAAGAQDNLAAGQVAARRGIGKNFFREKLRGNMVGVPGGNPLTMVKEAVKKVFANVGSTIVKSGGAKVLLLAAGALMCVMLPVFTFASCMMSGGASGGGGGGAEAFTAWAESIAKDDKVGYSQPNRTTFASRNQNDGWGDVDCSSFVYYALLNNGWTEEELGGSWPFATYGMCDILENCGFERIEYDRNEGARQLQRGDIVVDIDQHVEIYIGEGKAVAAHCDEHGGITGAQMGDQTGNEVSIATFSASYWQPDVIMRCTRGGVSGNIPDGLGKDMTYMGWQLITAPSAQLDFKNATGMPFDSEGFGKVNGRYVIACTTTYGQVGDMVDFTFDDGSTINCIIGDIKNPSDPGCNEWGHDNGNCIIEFVVDMNLWYPSHANPGTPGFHPEWDHYVVGYKNVGHYPF